MNQKALVAAVITGLATGCAAPEPPARHSFLSTVHSGPSTVRTAAPNVRIIPHNTGAAAPTARQATPSTTPRPGGIVVRSVATSKSNVLHISLKRDQSLSVKGRDTTLRNLPTTLRSQGATESTPLFLQVEAGTPYADVAKVLSFLQSSGFNNLAVVNDKKANDSSGKTQLKR